MVANVAVAPDDCSRQNMGERPDARAFTHTFGFADSLRVDEKGHWCQSFGLRHSWGLKQVESRTRDSGRFLEFSYVRQTYCPTIPRLKRLRNIEKRIRITSAV